MVNLAKVYSAQKDYAGAVELYEKALAVDLRNFDAMSGVVNATVAMGQSAKAHTRIAALMDANAGRADVLAGLHFLNSTVFSSEKNAASAQQELTAALNLDPDYLPAYSSLASIFASQNRVDDAIAQYQVIISKRPSAQPYTMLGILEESRGNTQAAETNYRKALEITPDTPIAANNLAWLIVDNQGNLDEALRLATLAVAKNQNVAGFYDTLGWIYLQKGLSAPAVEQLRKAVSLEEQNAQKTGTAPNPGYRVRLGMALAKAGDKANARKEVETGLRSADQMSQREVRDAKALLATL
jgi:tetratricopeptide (TPR) repeat protein